MPSKSSHSSHDPRQQTQHFAVHAARLLADGRCENVLLLDVRGISQVTDYLVIATGTSNRQIASALDDLKELAEMEGQSVYRQDGGGTSGWAVIDLIDVVAHVFAPEQRTYYDLESLWGDAARIDWASRTSPGQFARIGSRQSHR